MINLIPPTAKKKITLEYWVRVVSVWLMLWAAAFFAAAAISLPVYVLIGSQVKEHQASADAASQKVADFKNVSASLIQASQQASKIVNETKLPRLSNYIVLLEQIQNDDIQINLIKLGRDSGGLRPITVGGVATDRQALASFRDRLLKDESVTSVDLPISNLARDKDILFTITVMLSKPNDV